MRVLPAVDPLAQKHQSRLLQTSNALRARTLCEMWRPYPGSGPRFGVSADARPLPRPALSWMPRDNTRARQYT
eukprot:scaffold304691_cov30-Tisochrysis_lutea.AAC.1